MPNQKKKRAASNVITIRLPASCPLFRYTLNKDFGGTPSMPPGFQVPSVAPQAGQVSNGTSPGQTQPQANPVQSGGKAQGSTSPSAPAPQGDSDGQGVPAAGGDLPTHTAGQNPLPTDSPAQGGQGAAPPPQGGGGDLPTYTQGQPPPPSGSPAPQKRQDPSAQRQGPEASQAQGDLPVVKEGEQPPPRPGGQVASGPGGGAAQQGGEPPAGPAPQSQLPAPDSVPVDSTNPPFIATGAESGWLGVQEQGQNSTTVKQLQAEIGQIQVLPFPNSPYQLTLSGLKQTQYPWTSGTAYTQPFGPGWLTLDVTCPTSCSGQNFAFIGADITTEACPPGIQLQSATADDADNVITYAGFAPREKNNKVVEIKGDYKNTLSMTAHANSTASFKFRGTAVLVKGVTAPKLGDYCVTVDGTSTYLTSRDDIETHAVPLYFMTSLDDQQVHEVTVTSLQGPGGDIGLALDEVDIWGPAGRTGFICPDGSLCLVNGDTAVGGVPTPEEVTGGGGGTSAGVIVGAVLGTLAAIALAWWLLTKYNKVAEAKKEEKKMNPWDEANLLQNQKNEGVYITTVAEQRYVYPGLIAHSELK